MEHVGVAQFLKAGLVDILSIEEILSLWKEVCCWTTMITSPSPVAREGFSVCQDMIFKNHKPDGSLLTPVH
jgi:hypothetical protein